MKIMKISVGYGDIYCTTFLGRLFMVFFILGGLVRFFYFSNFFINFAKQFFIGWVFFYGKKSLFFIKIWPNICGKKQEILKQFRNVFL